MEKGFLEAAGTGISFFLEFGLVWDCYLAEDALSFTVCSRWRELQTSLSGYRGSLAAALAVHGFNRDVDDTQERISLHRVGISRVCRT